MLAKHTLAALAMGLCVALSAGAWLKPEAKNVNGRLVYGLVDEKGKMVVKPQYKYVRENKHGFSVSDLLGRQGLLGHDGKVIVPVTYDSENSSTADRIVVVKLNGHAGYYTLDGKAVVKPEKSAYTYFNDINGTDYAFSFNGLKVGVVKLSTGRELLAPEYHRLKLTGNREWMAVEQDGKYSLYDLKACAPLSQYGSAEDFVVTADGTVVRRNGDNLEFLSSTGQPRFTVKGFNVTSTPNGYTIQRHTLSPSSYNIDTNGNVTGPDAYEPECLAKMSSLGKQYHIYSSPDLKWGLCQADGTPITEALYDDLYYEPSDSTGYMDVGDRMGMFRGDGTVVVEPVRFNQIWPMLPMNRYAMVKEGNRCGLIDEQGRVVFEPADFWTMAMLNNSDSLVVASKGSRYGLYKLDGRQILPEEFDKIYNVNGRLEVSANGRKGIADYEGNILVPVMFEDAFPSSDSAGDVSYEHVTVKLNGREGIYDISGREIVPPGLYDSAYFHLEDGADAVPQGIVKSGDFCGIYDLDGNLLLAPTEFDSATLRLSDEASSGYVIDAWSSTPDGTLRHYIADAYTGQVIKDNKPEVERQQFLAQARDYYSSKDYKKAVQALDKALALRESPDLYYDRAVYKYNWGKYSQAIDDCHRCMEITNSNALSDRCLMLIVNAEDRIAERQEQNAMIAMMVLGVVNNVVSEITAPRPRTSASRSGGRSGRGSSSSASGESSSSSDSSSSSSEPVAKQKTCGACGGSGTVVDHGATYGNSDRKYCSECGKDVVSSHYHKKCPTCRGTGYVVRY